MLDIICSCLCFFFKQKTAYELRISDWSSDVCSSDLPPIPPRSWPIRRLPTCLIGLAAQPLPGRRCDHARRPQHRLGLDAAILANLDMITGNRRDRTSVVLGTSVSVRVDFGGSRII